MVKFSFAANKKILFGSGATRDLPQMVNPSDGTLLFLTGRSVSETALFTGLQTSLEQKGLTVIYKTVTGEPSPDIVDGIVREMRDVHVGTVAALGGGSVLDSAKAVSAMLCEEGSVEDFLEGVGTKTPSGQKVRFIALPTTAGTGSECTKNAVISRPGPEGFKKSLRHDNYIPDVAVIDPDWLEFLPRPISASCGMDAFSQLLESFLSTASSPLTDVLARQGLENFFRSFTPLLEGKADTREQGRYLTGSGSIRIDPGQCRTGYRPWDSRRSGRTLSDPPWVSLRNPYAPCDEINPEQPS